MSDKVFISGYTSEKISLNRRIKEILDDKGDAYTIPAFSRRIGISESTLYRCVKDRYIKPSELERIAEGLNMTTARLKQEDSDHKTYIKMKTLVEHKINFVEALRCTLEFFPKAAGCTEKFETLKCLGAIYFFQKKIKTALNTWLEALPYAQQLLNVWDETIPIVFVTKNLILAYTALKDYSRLSILLEDVEKNFDPNVLPSDFLGSVSYSKAVAALNTMDLDEYRTNVLEHLERFTDTGDPVAIGIAKHNVAYMYYKIKSLDEAKKYFEEAIAQFQSCDAPRAVSYLLISRKDYAKVLFATGRKDAAIQVIDDSLTMLDASKNNTVHAKLLILKSIYTDDASYADEALHLAGISVELKQIAIDVLMKYCARTGDAEGLISIIKLATRLPRLQKIKWGNYFEKTIFNRFGSLCNDHFLLPFDNQAGSRTSFAGAFHCVELYSVVHPVSTRTLPSSLGGFFIFWNGNSAVPRPDQIPFFPLKIRCNMKT